MAITSNSSVKNTHNYEEKDKHKRFLGNFKYIN